MENDLTLGIDLEITFTDDDLELQWRRLINEIIKGNVIPVIGPDFLIAESKNLHQQIIDFLSKKFNVQSKPTSFSQLIYDESFPTKLRGKIYTYVNRVILAVHKAPNELLVRLLQTQRFPFVITTSFTPIVEQVMTSVYGKQPKVLIFRNDPQLDKVPGVGDIRNARDMSEPTVFYMLGKHCDCDLQHSYVLTDVDMMQYCSKWVSGVGTPTALTNIIKDKYLLVLGNNYSDWLLRFIWYSLRSNEKLNSSLFVKDQSDDTLMEFLNRLEVFTQTDPEYVVNEIEKRLEDMQKDALKNVTETYSSDVFLSYSHKDKHIAINLMNALSEHGLSVWMDEEGGIQDAENWRAAIVNGIKSCCIFVPLLTANVEKEFTEEHEYRIEWKIAAQKASKMGNIPFIFPVTEKGFNFYNDKTNIPDELTEKNAVWYDAGSDFSNIAERIRTQVEQVKNYKNL